MGTPQRSSLPRRGKEVFPFVEARSAKPVGDKAVCNRTSELARAAGVRMTMKTLRQGFGCHYAGQMSAHVLQRLMRHSSIRVTMDNYANVDQAVEVAVRTAKRNTSRNSQPSEAPAPAEEEGGKPSGEQTSG